MTQRIRSQTGSPSSSGAGFLPRSGVCQMLGTWRLWEGVHKSREWLTVTLCVLFKIGWKSLIQLSNEQIVKNVFFWNVGKLLPLLKKKRRHTERLFKFNATKGGEEHIARCFPTCYARVSLEFWARSLEYLLIRWIFDRAHFNRRCIYIHTCTCVCVCGLSAEGNWPGLWLSVYTFHKIF